MKVKLFLAALFVFLATPSAQAELSDVDDLMAGFAEKIQSVSKSVGTGYADPSSFILYNSNTSSVPEGANLYRYASSADGESLIFYPITNESNFRSASTYNYRWVDNQSSLPFATNAETENSLINPQMLLEAEKVSVYMDVNVNHQSGFPGGQYFSEGFTFNKKLSDVPDPGSFFLLGLGALALALVRRKSAKSPL